MCMTLSVHQPHHHTSIIVFHIYHLFFFKILFVTVSHCQCRRLTLSLCYSIVFTMCSSIFWVTHMPCSRWCGIYSHRVHNCADHISNSLPDQLHLYHHWFHIHISLPLRTNKPSQTEIEKKKFLTNNLLFLKKWKMSANGTGHTYNARQ